MPGVFRVESPVDRDVLARAVRVLVERHDRASRDLDSGGC